MGYHSPEDRKSGEAPHLSHYFVDMTIKAAFNCLSWEASIEKCIKEELFSSLEVGYVYFLLINFRLLIVSVFNPLNSPGIYLHVIPLPLISLLDFYNNFIRP